MASTLAASQISGAGDGPINDSSAPALSSIPASVVDVPAATSAPEIPSNGTPDATEKASVIADAIPDATDQASTAADDTPDAIPDATEQASVVADAIPDDTDNPP